MITRRGLFGAMAAAGIGGFMKLAPAEAASTGLTGDGLDLCELKWFNRHRGFGYMRSMKSGLDFRVDKEIFEKAGIKEQRFATIYFVRWDTTAERGPRAYEICGCRPWTDEEKEQWFKRQGYAV